MDKLGLVRDIDLALHLPLRYEDETRLTPIAALREGDSAQVEGVVRSCVVETRTRRQLVVRLVEGAAELVLRFVHFFPSHQKTLAVGARVRADHGENKSSSPVKIWRDKTQDSSRSTLAITKKRLEICKVKKFEFVFAHLTTNFSINRLEKL